MLSYFTIITLSSGIIRGRKQWLTQGFEHCWLSVLKPVIVAVNWGQNWQTLQSMLDKNGRLSVQCFQQEAEKNYFPSILHRLEIHLNRGPPTAVQNRYLHCCAKHHSSLKLFSYLLPGFRPQLISKNTTMCRNDAEIVKHGNNAKITKCLVPSLT